MKIVNSIEINRSAKTVIELLENRDNYFKWDPYLESYETFFGNPGEVGAKTRFIFKLGKKKIDLVEAIETITYHDFPSGYHSTYETMEFSIIQKNCFAETEPDRTVWVLEQEYDFKDMPKLFRWLFRLSLKKKTKKTMNRVKKIAEKN